MAKKKEIQAQGQALSSGHIPRLLSYLPQGSVTPRVEERYTNFEWVYFGSNNYWPEEWLELVQNTAPLQRSAHTLAQLIAGNGIRFFKRDMETEVEAARDKLQELLEHTTEEDFLYKLALDIAILNAPFGTIRRAAGGDIVRLDHLDVSRMRSGELNKETGEPDHYFWSSNWKKRGRHERYREVKIPRYRKGEVTGKIEAFYGKTYGPGSAGDVYAFPWALGCRNACEVWAKVDAYNQTQIDTGFAPGTHIHTFTNKSEAELKKYDDAVIAAFGGVRGEGVWHTFSEPGDDMAPQVTIIPRGNHAGELDEIRDGAERVIYNSYGMPAILMGVDTKTGMDGASSAIQQAQVQLDRLLVIPKQQIITKLLTRIMNDIGFKDVWDAKIDAISLVAPEQDQDLSRQATMASMRKNEYRKLVLKLDPVDPKQGDLFLNEGVVKEKKEVDPADKKLKK